MSEMSLVEPHSYYRDSEAFLQVAQGTLEAKSAWSTRSSLRISSRESYRESDVNDCDSGDESGASDIFSLASTMQEAIMIYERYQELLV